MKLFLAFYVAEAEVVLVEYLVKVKLAQAPLMFTVRKFHALFHSASIAFLLGGFLRISMCNKINEGLGVSNSLLCFTPDCYHRLLDSLYHQCFSL